MLKKIEKYIYLDYRFIFLKNIIKSEKISLYQIIKYLFSFKRIIIRCVIVFSLIGLVFFSSSEKYFIAESTIIPDSGIPPSSEISEFQDLLTIPSTNTIGIESFENIINGTSFLKKILEEEIYSENFGKFVSIEEYLLNTSRVNSLQKVRNYISNVKSKFLNLFKSTENDQVPGVTVKFKDTLQFLTSYEKSLISTFKSKVEIKGTKSVKITTIAPEAKFSARLNNLLIEKLGEEASRLKTGKLRRDLSLLTQKLDSAKTKFEESQLKLAKYRDENKGFKSSISLTKLEKLTSDFNLYSNIYQEAAINVESLKMELIAMTPFYSIYEPPYVPEFPNGGFSLTPVIKSIFFGLVFSIMLSAFYTFLCLSLIFKNNLINTKLIDE